MPWAFETTMNTQQMKEAIECAGFQFLKDSDGWACFDEDDRSEVPGSRAFSLGNAIWQTAEALGLGN